MKPTKNETTEPLPSWSREVGLPARTGSITSCKGEVEAAGEPLLPLRRDLVPTAKESATARGVAVHL